MGSVQVSRSFCGILAVNVILSHCSGLSFCEPLFTHFIASEKNQLCVELNHFCTFLLLIIARTRSLREGHVFSRVSVCSNSIRTGWQALGSLRLKGFLVIQTNFITWVWWNGEGRGRGEGRGEGGQKLEIYMVALTFSLKTFEGFVYS